MFGFRHRNPGAANLAQPQNIFLAQKFLAFSFLSYLAAAWSLHYCVTTSMSYLHVMSKISEGIHAMIWGNFALLNSFLLLKVVIYLLFGDLRLIEYEHILERISYTVISLLFSFSSGNSPVSAMLIQSIPFVFCRTLHWILKDRMELTFQANNSHTTLRDVLLSRFMFSLGMVTSLDITMVSFYVGRIRFYKSSFAHFYNLFIVTQYAILVAELLQVIMRTGLNLAEISIIQHRVRAHRAAGIRINDPAADGQQVPDVAAEDDEDDDENMGLEGKFIYERLIDVFVSIIKVAMNFSSSLFTGRVMMITVAWEAIATFKSAKALWKNWKSSKSLDASLLNATDSQIESGEIDICIVCMDDFLPSEQRKSDSKKVKVLPCGHALHLSCLKNWIARSPTCPMCRLPIFDEKGTLMPYQNTSETAEPVEDDRGGNLVGVTGTAVQANAASVENANQNEPTSSEELLAVDPVSASIRSTSLVLPVEKEQDDKHTFKIVTESGIEIEGSLILRNNVDLNGGSIVLHEDSLVEQDVTQLKRKIADLEGKLEELSKKIKRD
ncbi:unnamed protein product [Kluyveromyces dobzhanskii CBS 2104]|uniref:WGS project CCBQ000000000 data, contig 00099 n=1 Tax=Kluyveromyces dobzhanskii CBS 2104 TaxID=1427455 RepID=A0A0A8L4D3_9SACH|nr:unnamed protein product [Kluyveromyces dobzhanskii CBS 2104]